MLAGDVLVVVSGGLVTGENAETSASPSYDTKYTVRFNGARASCTAVERFFVCCVSCKWPQ